MLFSLKRKKWTLRKNFLKIQLFKNIKTKNQNKRNLNKKKDLKLNLK